MRVFENFIDSPRGDLSGNFFLASLSEISTFRGLLKNISSLPSRNCIPKKSENPGVTCKIFFSIPDSSS